MLNSTVPATPSSHPFSLMLIIETLLFVSLREEFAVRTEGEQADSAYRYGL